jgi:hypothetical protein
MIFKRKFRWLIELDDKQYFVKISCRPAPNFSESDQYPGDIVFTLFLHKNNLSPDFNNKTVKLFLYDGCGNPLEEWNLLNTKLLTCQDNSYPDDDFYQLDVTISYENVTYKPLVNIKEYIKESLGLANEPNPT